MQVVLLQPLCQRRRFDGPFQHLRCPEAVISAGAELLAGRRFSFCGAGCWGTWAACSHSSPKWLY